MANELAFAQHTLSTGHISSYAHWVNQIPMLSAEEEHELATNLQKNNDLRSARRLILSHLRLVVKIARGYDGYGLQQADLIQEGNIGLMKAVKRFDPEVGVRLVSFAIHWIRAEIHEFILRNWRIVKIATTKAQRKLFFNLRRASKKRSWLSAAEIKTVAEELGVNEKDVRQMEQRMSNHDASFELSSDDDSEQSWGPAQYLEDHSSRVEQNVVEYDWSTQRHSQLYTALKTLDDRSRDILEQRWLASNKKTLHELAEQYQVSAERVRQLEKNALNKLKLAIGLSS